MLVLTCALLRLWLKVLSDSSPPSWRRGDIQAWLQCPLKLPRKSFKKKVNSWYFVLYVNFLTFIQSPRGSIRYNLLQIMICLNKGPGLGLQCQSLNSVNVGTPWATSCSNQSHFLCTGDFCQSLFLHNRILQPQNVAKNQIEQNLCILLWQLNSAAVSKIFHKNSSVHTKRFVAVSCRCNVLPQLAARCDLSPQRVAATYCLVCSNLHSAQAQNAHRKRHKKTDFFAILIVHFGKISVQPHKRNISLLFHINSEYIPM